MSVTGVAVHVEVDRSRTPLTPLFAIITAVALPMPLDAPVTMANLPVKDLVSMVAFALIETVVKGADTVSTPSNSVASYI